MIRVKVRPVTILHWFLVSSDKNFHNDSDTIRYRINYLKVGIFDIDTKNFNGFWLKSVNSERLIEQLDEFQNWNLQCFSSVNGQYK